MSTRKPHLIFYFDICSAYSYLSFAVINRSGVFKDCDVVYAPIQKTKLMYDTGNAGPMVVKNKAEYISHDFIRQAGRFNVAVRRGVPPAFSKPSATTQLALTAIGIHFPHRMEDAINSLFKAFWVEYKDTTNPSVLTEILSHIFGNENTAARIVKELSNSDAVKARFTATNETAIKDMAFGCPTFIATNAAGHKDVYWGFDHLGMVIDFLGVQRPNDRNWSALV